MCTEVETNQKAVFPIPETKFNTTRLYDEWLEGKYTVCSKKDSHSAFEGRTRGNGLNGASQTRKPAHGKGKELRLVKKAIIDLSPSPEHSASSVAAPQTSSSGKRKKSLIEDEGDSHDDVNFKHKKTSVSADPDNPPLILKDVNYVQDNGAEIRGSFVSDPGDVADQARSRHCQSIPLAQTTAAFREPSTFEGDKFITEVSREWVEFAWIRLCKRLLAAPVDDVLSMQDDVDKALKGMRDVSQMSLATLEAVLKSFFQSVHSFHYARLQSSSSLTVEACSQKLSSTMTRHADVKSQVEAKGKHLQTLEKMQEDLCSQIQQEREALELLQSEVSTLDKDISSLKDSVAVSRDGAARVQQTEMDLEMRKQELQAFEITF